MRPLLPVLLLLAACNTLPVGYDQLGHRVSATQDTLLTVDSAASYSRYVPLGVADTMVFGRDGEYESRILVRFPIPETLDVDSVESVQLVFHRRDTIALGFVCRPCSTAWLETGVSWLMTDSFARWNTAGGDYWKVDVASGRLEGDSTVVDMAYRSLDPAVRGALRVNGVIVFPTDTGFTSVYAGGTAANAPRVRIKYRGSDDTETFDTSGDAALVDTSQVSVGPWDLLVGSGFAFRTWLSFRTDSTDFPKAATVAKAELTFKPEVLYRRTESLAFGVHRLTESYPVRGANARFQDLPEITRYYLRPADGDTMVRLNITNLVQYWTTHPDSNFGLILRSEPEWTKLFRFRVRRSGENAPRLAIQFVMPPEDRFYEPGR